MPSRPIRRRAFLRSLAAAAAAAASTTAAQAQSPKPTRPNIVLIMADDMGFSDIGCYGGEISTPTLDKLAAGGIRFTQFYNAARCCPTRASLLTGLYPHQAGIGHMVEPRPGYPSYQGYLNDKCVTIGEAMRTAGYATYLSGKWHVGEQRPHWPVDRGFDRSYALISGATNYFKLDSGRQMAIDDKPFTPQGDDFYITDAFADNAVKFINEHASTQGKQKPFFLYLPFTAPHWPLHAWPKDIAKYRGKYKAGWDTLREQRHARMKKLGIVKDNWPMAPRDPDAPAWDSVKDKDLEDHKMAVYAAQVDRMDQGIGRVVAALRAAGVEENTLIFFLADNGGCAEEVHPEKGSPRNTWGDPDARPGPVDSYESYGLPWANASNTPFRMFKHWVHEGGISSPLICHWPAGIRGARRGSLTDSPGHLIDIMATCLDVAGASYPKTHKGVATTPLEGKSLAPVFATGRRDGHAAIFWEHEGNRAVRQGQWKLVSRYDTKDRKHGQWELYDLQADRTELKDLTATNSAKARELASLYDGWAKRAGVVSWDQLTASAARDRKGKKKKQ